MLVAGVVLWVIIGIVYVIYKLGAEAFGSAAIGILSVLLVVACFVSLGAAIELTQSIACAILAGVLPICLLFGWAGDNKARGIVVFEVFTVLSAPFGLIDLFRSQNPLGLIVVVAAVVVYLYEKSRPKGSTANTNQTTDVQSNGDISERRCQLARELQDRTHIPPACVYTWAENSQFCELLEVAKQSSKLNDAIIYPLMQQVLREQKPKGQVAFNMRSSIIAVHKALQSATLAEGRDD